MAAIGSHMISGYDRRRRGIHTHYAQGRLFLCVLDENRGLGGIVTRNELFEVFAQGKSPANQGS
jgi:hypothetical protein